MIDPKTQLAEDISFAIHSIPDPAKRQAYLENACEGDAALRAQVEEMLTAVADGESLLRESAPALETVVEIAESFLESGALQSGVCRPEEEEKLGDQIGPYKLLQKIGEGGCGGVYMAEQEHPVRRRVALKFIKPGMDTKSVVAHFKAERQAMALMDHPGIARILDAGTTATGRPYFVMELVHGTSITEYCDSKNLGTRQRLELFIQVCQAIQHAHQKGIIHRDIKPSNILVTLPEAAAPLPKVIDFGVAKAIEQNLTDQTHFTLHGDFIGTPTYMSPEQAQMNTMDVDTRSDIYSLGVLLYELLTGRTPFDRKALLAEGYDGFRRTLRDIEPPRPSLQLERMSPEELESTARHRNTEPQKLRSELRSDLDWLVLKALEKDRNRRYQTANGLAADVRRYLDNEPIIARPPTRLYRIQKMLHRNKVLFLTGTAAALAVTFGFGFSTFMYVRERSALRRAVNAEQQQLLLRRRAEDREKMTQAAFQISRGQLENADSLVGKVTSLRPSLESESVLRTLGEWHVFRDEWDQAAMRFNQLLEADQEDNSWEITDDLLRVGPILIERGDLRGYERFRTVAMARFAGTTDPIFAERTLKISLLAPASSEVLKTLEAFYNVAAESIEREKGNVGNAPIMASWRCISLGLMAYRQNLTPTAKAWCQRSIDYWGDGSAHLATAHLIIAMSCQRLGELDQARSELATGKQLVDAAFAGGLKQGDGIAGFWFDWIFARVLLNEAQSLIPHELPATP